MTSDLYLSDFPVGTCMDFEITAVIALLFASQHCQMYNVQHLKNNLSYIRDNVRMLETLNILDNVENLAKFSSKTGFITQKKSQISTSTVAHQTTTQIQTSTES